MAGSTRRSCSAPQSNVMLLLPPPSLPSSSSPPPISDCPAHLEGLQHRLAVLRQKLADPALFYDNIDAMMISCQDCRLDAFLFAWTLYARIPTSHHPSRFHLSCYRCGFLFPWCSFPGGYHPAACRRCTLTLPWRYRTWRPRRLASPSSPSAFGRPAVTVLDADSSC